MSFERFYVCLITIGFVLFLGGCIQPTDQCGDGVCTVGENSSTCCTDCGCESGYYCENNTYVGDIIYWEDDVLLANVTSGPTELSVIATESDIYVIWKKYDQKTSEVYYARSSDGGETWKEERMPFDNDSEFYLPSIAITEDDIHVVWQTKDARFMYMKSSDGGDTWEEEKYLTTDSLMYQSPEISASGNNVFIIWQALRQNGSEIQHKLFYTKSSDGGENWSDTYQLTNSTNAHISYHPSQPIFAVGEEVHALWRDQDGGGYAVKYRKSSDGGETWKEERMLKRFVEAETGGVIHPSAFTVTGGKVYFIWTESYRDEEYTYLIMSSDGGETWEEERLIANTTGNYPSITVTENNIHLVWGYGSGIYYTRVTYTGEEYFLTGTQNQFVGPSIAAAGNEVHVVWYDTRDGKEGIYYKRYDNTTLENPKKV